MLKIVNFGEYNCFRKQGGVYLVGAAPDGVFGVRSISVPNLLENRLIRNSSSSCLNENGFGMILFYYDYN